jgi:hypothetical protein
MSAFAKGSVTFALLASNDTSGFPSANPQKKQKPMRTSNSLFMALDISSCCFFQSSGDKSNLSGGKGHHQLRGHFDRSESLVLPGISIFNSDSQSHRHRGLANATFEAGFERGGLSTAPQRASSASR